MSVALELIAEERVLLNDISWEAYEALLKTWQDKPARLTYDRGTLEIMSPLHSHEQYGTLLGRLVETFTLGLGIPLHSGGSTTFRRMAKMRGLEPDECYWIQNEPSMRTRKEYDPESDPPPDLAIEVEITRSVLDRMNIYASLDVPEVWRFADERLTIHGLAESGIYEVRDSSVALPQLLPATVERFLAMSNEVGETEVLTAFLDWVRTVVKLSKHRKSRKTSRRSHKD